MVALLKGKNKKINKNKAATGFSPVWHKQTPRPNLRQHCVGCQPDSAQKVHRRVWNPCWHLTERIRVTSPQISRCIFNLSEPDYIFMRDGKWKPVPRLSARLVIPAVSSRRRAKWTNVFLPRASSEIWDFSVCSPAFNPRRTSRPLHLISNL